MASEIIAILPEEVKKNGIYARVFTNLGTILDQRTPTLYLDHMYKKEGKSKKQIDSKTRKILQISKNLPYVIDANHVFFPFKYRTTTYDKQTRGFANVKYVANIRDNEIILTTGESISTLSKFDALNTNKNYARLMLDEEIIRYYTKMNSTIRFVSANVMEDLY